MDYPVWYLPEIGGGTLIAMIAVAHVFVSHFAVGGGLYLVFAERKGLREGNREILNFTRSHARFFLLMTAVFGAISGVGIWFIISLVNPVAVSLLIHNFIFAWASEWVMFGVELVAIFVYFYSFDRMEPRTHQAIGWIYFVSAFFSLFLINGIITFMLSPGEWPDHRDFWDGFFNPTFWPSLWFRTSVACMLAGVYAFLTTACLGDPKLKLTMTRFSGKWVLVSMICTLAAGFWYLRAIPGKALILVEGASPTIQMTLQWGAWAIALLIVATCILVLLKPSLHTIPLSIIVFISAFVFMGSFEWTREAARRPFAINGILFSNGLLPGDMDRLNRNGFLPSIPWSTVKEARSEDDLEAGRELFRFQCYACHTAGGGNNDIIARARGMSHETLEGYIANLHRIRYFMPPFAGSDQERGALAAYIVKGLRGEEVEEPAGASGGNGEGKELFTSHCTVCHPESLVKDRTRGWDYGKIRSALDNLNRLQKAMPDFTKPPEVKDRIAGYIYSLNSPGGTMGGEGEKVRVKP